MTELAHNIELIERTKDVLIDDNVTFQSMFLSKKLFDGLSLCGFKKPSPIQLKAIPLGRCGFDLIVKSKSGTGKTVVFSVIALEMIDVTQNDVQVLILAPTREIAVQSADVIRNVGKLIEGLKVNTFIGGTPEKEDIDKAKSCHIAVGAPGRIKSLIKQNFLKLNSLKLFVLDEADKLLENQFQNDITEIYNNLPIRKQILALSATYSNDLNEFLNNLMQSPTHVNAELETPLLLGLKQFLIEIKENSNVSQEMKLKNEELLKILSNVPFTQCLIFSNYQTRVETISSMLNRHDWNSTFISAAKTQSKRLEALDSLKNFKCRVLLSTDLTARGIDAANVNLIINYDVPFDVMTYLHRMGRAGRYGSKGICITLCSGKKDMKEIKKFIGSIGGTKMTIPVLPDLNEHKFDLWSIDTNEFKQISGVIEDDHESLNIKNEVLEIKCKKYDSSKTILEELSKGTFDFENTEDKKRKWKSDSNETSQSSCNDDILKALANGEFDFTKITTTTDEKKMKYCNKDIEDVDKTEIFIKNKALYETAKILTDQNQTIDLEMEKNLNNYFEYIIEQDKTTERDDLDDLFVHAYKFTLNEEKDWKKIVPQDEFKDEIKIKREEKKKDVPKEDSYYYDETEECYEDETEDIECDETGKRIYEYEDIPNRMVWVPVEESVLDKKVSAINLLDSEDESNSSQHQIDHYTTTSETREYTNQTTISNRRDMNVYLNDNRDQRTTRNYNNDYFTDCLEECSNDLWRNGLNYDTIDDFDNYFYDWQRKVWNVTDYIRQNLYVKEMSEYQRNKEN